MIIVMINFRASSPNLFSFDENQGHGGGGSLMFALFGPHEWQSCVDGSGSFADWNLWDSLHETWRQFKPPPPTSTHLPPKNCHVWDFRLRQGHEASALLILLYVSTSRLSYVVTKPVRRRQDNRSAGRRNSCRVRVRKCRGIARIPNYWCSV